MAIVHNRDLSIYFDDVGTGPPVILGHSFLCSGEMWREQLPVLAAGHRVLNPDLRGHGRSGEVTRAFSLYDAVADVLAVLDELGIEKAVWCGLSIGGMVALRAALTCPERVEGVILMDTDAGPETRIRKLKYRGMGSGARLLGIGPFLSPVTRLMFGPTTRRRNRALVEEWKNRFSTVHVPSMLRGLEALVQRDSLLTRLSRIRVPALVLVGREDRSLPPARSRRIHDLLPNSTLVEIPAAGHLAALEQPGPVNEAMMDFLRRNDETTGPRWHEKGQETGDG